MIARALEQLGLNWMAGQRLHIRCVVGNTNTREFSHLDIKKLDRAIPEAKAIWLTRPICF